MRLTALLAMALTVVACPYSSQSAEPAAAHASSVKPGHVAVLVDHVSGLDTAYARQLVQRLAEEGMSAEAISCAQLADPSVLTSERIGALVLTHSPRFPAVAYEHLMAHIRAGGDLVLMGGKPLSVPLIEHRGKWRTKGEVETDLAKHPQDHHMLFDFEDRRMSLWRRGASNKNASSEVVSDEGTRGLCMRLDLCDVTWYDVFTAALPSAVPSRHNALCLWAKGDERTPQLFVEVREKDGSRWSRAVDVTTEWQFRVLPQETFLFKADGSPKTRGGKDDGLRLADAAQITFGLAKERTPRVGPAHTLWIDEVASCSCDPEVAAAQTKMELREAFDDYDVYRLRDVATARANENQDWLRLRFEMTGAFPGLSAVGFDSPHESTFVPLLSARDRHGRTRGWAAGMLIHHAGPYAGSQWGLFGIENQAFYRNGQTLDLVVELLRGFRSGKWLDRARREEKTTAVKGLPLRTPAPPPLTIRDGHFVYPNGRRFFMIGVNFWSSFDTFYGGGVQWDVRRLERDFTRMERAGINAIRIHGFNRFALAKEPHRLDTFLELCRRHRIYVLAGINLGKHSYLRDGKDAMQAEARRLAGLLKDEPVILGYDLQNEPYWWEIARVPCDGTTLGDRFPAPKGAWDEYFRSLNVCEGNWTSTFPGLQGLLPVPKDPRLRQAYDNVNAIMGTWIGWLIEAIRSEDSRHPITVGYNTILDCLPANKPLDFVSHHCYEAPVDLDHVRINLTTMDRLKLIWPDRPITLGEFGYSSGDLIAGQLLDVYTQSVGEIVHYLYALANDYDGVMKWQLCDANRAYQWRFAKWRRKDPETQRLRQRRFGMFWPDGTPEGRAKPIAHATRFLRDCIDAGLTAGRLELRPDPSLIGTGYVFRGRNVLFVGGTAYRSDELVFKSDRPVNVMVRWAEQELTLLATADAAVSLDIHHLVPTLRPETATVTGRLVGRGVENGRLRLQLLEGETLRIRGKP